MMPCSTCAISLMETVSITDIVLGTMSPCRLKFTTNRNPVSGLISILAGNRPACVSATERSVPVSYLKIEP